MIAGIARAELHIPDSDNLKAKRKVVSSLIGRIKARFNVSISEVAHQELWQRAGIAVAVVSSDNEMVSGTLDKIRGMMDSDEGCELTSWDYKTIDPEKDW